MHAHVDNMDLRRDSINTLRQSLTDAFGSATDAGQMNHTVVVGGPYGLRRFYMLIIDPFLDEINRDDYEDIFKLLMDSSRALARKCGNYIKVLYACSHDSFGIDP